MEVWEGEEAVAAAAAKEIVEVGVGDCLVGGCTCEALPAPPAALGDIAFGAVRLGKVLTDMLLLVSVEEGEESAKVVGCKVAACCLRKGNLLES